MNMQALFIGGYFVIGFVQLFAIVEALEIYLDWGILNYAGAFFVTYIPLLGSVLGVLGAMEGWGWSLIQSLLLFFWYIPAFIFYMIISKFASIIDN